MIALLFASRAFAQEAPPVEPPPAEPAPAEEPPPAEIPAPEPEPEPEPEPAPQPEPGWEPVTVEPSGEVVPAPAAEVEPQLELTPWVEVPDDPRGRLLRFGIAAEIGSLGNDDPAYDLFSNGDAMGSGGIAMAFTVVNHLAVVGSWHHFRHGATIAVQQTETDADFESDSQELRSGWMAHEGAAGLRIDAGIRDVLFPFVSGQGLMMAARMRLDDDPSERDNPGQVQASGTAWGAMGTAGIELRIPPQSKIQAAWTLEFGHAWFQRAEFGKFGSMQPGGFVARSGLGLRF